MHVINHFQNSGKNGTQESDFSDNIIKIQSVTHNKNKMEKMNESV